MYTNTTAQVLFPDGDTEFFEILARVLQGDTLAPSLFIIALDYAMRQAVGNGSILGFTRDRSRSRRHPAEVTCDTDFADNIALLSNTSEQGQLLLSRLETSAKLIGLHTNNSKIAYMKFSQGEGDVKALRVDTAVETKLDFKLVKTTGHCSTVHGEFLVVLDLLVTTTSTDTLASKGTLSL